MIGGWGGTSRCRPTRRFWPIVSDGRGCARAQRELTRTLRDMPRPRPPRTTTAGSLRAAGTPPALQAPPVFDETAPSAVRGESPLVGLHRPEAVGRPPVVVVRRLDGGRLYAPTVTDAVAWSCSIRLEADVSQPQCVLLRPAPKIIGEFNSTSRPHVDGSGRLVLPEGIRFHLGVGKNDEVVAIARVDHLEIVTVGRMLTGLAALDAIATLRATPSGPLVVRIRSTSSAIATG